MIEGIVDGLVMMEVTSNPSTMLAHAEAQIIEHVLKKNRYNQSKTAKLLGVSRGTLRTKLQQYFGDEYVGHREGNNNGN